MPELDVWPLRAMSYFMTISGKLPAGDFSPVEFMPISKGQKYIANLESELSMADGAPVWFAHDGQTGTSHDFVSEAQNHCCEHGSFEGTLLYRLMSACVMAGCVFRIWWASDALTCYRNLTEYSSLDELCSGIAKMHDISVRRVNGAA